MTPTLTEQRPQECEIIIKRKKMEETNQHPNKCKHFCPMSGGLCSLDIKETKILGGGFWIKCCDIVDDPEYVCPDYEPSKDE